MMENWFKYENSLHNEALPNSGSAFSSKYLSIFSCYEFYRLLKRRSIYLNVCNFLIKKKIKKSILKTKKFCSFVIFQNQWKLQI